MLDRTSLIYIAVNARKFLETIWPDWQLEKYQCYGGLLPTIMSYSTCARSSTFLQRVLHDFKVDSEVRHGWFVTETSAGSVDAAHRHSWTVGNNSIIDITADQFGADDVIVTEQSDRRYVSDVDVALPEFRLLRSQSVLRIWPQWLESPMREKLLIKHGF